MPIPVSDWLRSLLWRHHGAIKRTSRQPRRRACLHVEQLEFRYAPSLTTVASFNGANGELPEGVLVEDSSGNLFGMTEYGGPA